MCIVKILNCNVQSLTTKELLEELDEGVLITPNLDHLVKLQKDREFYDLYKKLIGWFVIVRYYFLSPSF